MTLTKANMDRIEFWSKILGIAFGIVAAFVALLQFGQSLAQNKKELRWKQAGLAREMVNKMLEDEGWDAMLMLDWEDQGREFEIKTGVREVIKRKDIDEALAVED